MPKCFKCKEDFDDYEVEMDEEGRYICGDCAEGGDDQAMSRCPKCQEESVEIAQEGECPNCGYVP